MENKMENKELTEKEIYEVELNKNCTFSIIYKIFKDVIYKPTEENVNNILTEYTNNKNKTLFGYFINKELIGIIGVENKQTIEILHFGIHENYRNRYYETKLMDYIKNKYFDQKIYLTTDDDAVGFYKKYGYKITEYYEEKNGKEYKRYKCEI
jgi:ribosomal protein S18 acetylase RimI-like enzyme